jgi:hypothetical protein
MTLFIAWYARNILQLNDILIWVMIVYIHQTNTIIIISFKWFI